MAVTYRKGLFRSRLGGGVDWFPVVTNGIALAAALVVLLTIQPASVAFRSGTVASSTVVAQHQATYIDQAATALRRKQIIETVPVVYHLDPASAKSHLAEGSRFLRQAATVFAVTGPVGQRARTLRRLIPPDVPSELADQIAPLSLQDFRVVRALSLPLLTQAAAWRFNEAQVTPTEVGLLSTLPHQTSLAQRNGVQDVLHAFLAPTMVLDIQATRAAQRRAAEKVRPVLGKVYPGQVVVRRGDLITPTIMAEIRALGLAGTRSGNEVLAAIVYAGMAVGILFWYLAVFHAGILRRGRLLLMFDAGICGALLAAQLLTAGHVLLPLFLPIAGFATFLAALIAPDAAIAVGFTIAFLLGWVVGDSLELAVYYLLTSIAGVLVIQHVQKLKQFLLAGVAMAVLGLATLLAFGLANGPYDQAALQDYVFAAAFNGLTSALLALGAFAFLSDFFGITTPLHLLELGQPNQPLMRRLMLKAPGTYNHSLIVATMVEQAAQEIGANPLAAKIAALYHDVGKTSNPSCFSENQLGTGNIHDSLPPEESARLIRGHVTQGVKLARQHRLPQVVIDAIWEHHGTTTIQFFVHKAREQSVDGWIDLSVYRYPGPRPSSKETALIMLADGCESAVRSASDHSPERIDETINKIFSERIAGGQLDDCPLTLRDIDAARSAFHFVLNSLYHPRVEYPEIETPIPGTIERETLRG